MLVVMFAFNHFISTSTANAQCFQPAVVTEFNTDPGNITVGGNTGNDLKIYDDEIMRVNVWDGSYCGLGWDYFDGSTTHTGFLVIDDGADPDVSLIHNGTDWYALVARTNFTDGGIYLDIYLWNTTGNEFDALSINTLLSSNTGAYTNNVNIDADIVGNFAIIWDDANTGNIEMTGGFTNTNDDPELSANGVKTIPNTEEYYYPDVSLYTNYLNDVLVNYSYTDQSGSAIYVGTDDFADLIGTASLSNSSPFTEVYNGTIDHPRIASAPTDQFTNTNLWTVVAAHAYNGRIDIVGHTLWANTVYDYVYTDGSMSNNLCDIGSDWYNRFPVVTYCNATRGIIVGWASTYDQSVDFTPYGLIALRCLYDGSYYPITTYHGYLVVNSDNTNNTWEYMLSVAGRDGDVNSHNVLYTFFYENEYDVMYKEVDWLAPTLRLEEKQNINIYPNPFTTGVEIELPLDTEYSLNISDISGRIIFSKKGTVTDLNRNLKSTLRNTLKGIYIVEATDLSTGVVSRSKVVKL
jgi:hypothetical protein